jgi:hypothetical protein
MCKAPRNFGSRCRVAVDGGYARARLQKSGGVPSAAQCRIEDSFLAVEKTEYFFEEDGDVVIHIPILTDYWHRS